MRSLLSHTAAPGLLSATVLLVCACAPGEPSASVEEPRGAPVTDEAPAAAGTTAQLAVRRATLRAHVSDHLSRSSLNLKLRQRADGLTHVDVVRGFRSASVAVRNADGTLGQRCLSDEEGALELLDGTHE